MTIIALSILIVSLILIFLILRNTKLGIPSLADFGFYTFSSRQSEMSSEFALICSTTKEFLKLKNTIPTGRTLQEKYSNNYTILTCEGRYYGKVAIKHDILEFVIVFTDDRLYLFESVAKFEKGCNEALETHSKISCKIR